MDWYKENITLESVSHGKVDVLEQKAFRVLLSFSDKVVPFTLPSDMHTRIFMVLNLLILKVVDNKFTNTFDPEAFYRSENH